MSVSLDTWQQFSRLEFKQESAKIKCSDVTWSFLVGDCGDVCVHHAGVRVSHKVNLHCEPGEPAVRTLSAIMPVARLNVELAVLIIHPELANPRFTAN